MWGTTAILAGQLQQTLRGTAAQLTAVNLPPWEGGAARAAAGHWSTLRAGVGTWRGRGDAVVAAAANLESTRILSGGFVR